MTPLQHEIRAYLRANLRLRINHEQGQAQILLRTPKEEAQLHDSDDGFEIIAESSLAPPTSYMSFVFPPDDPRAAWEKEAGR